MERSGQEQLLVTTTSATCRLDQKQSDRIFPINADHSGMVKFPKDFNMMKIVCQKLEQICGIESIDKDDDNTHGVGKRYSREELSDVELSKIYTLEGRHFLV